MKSIPLKAEVRERTGSNEVRRLRKEGFIPAVFYGPGDVHILLKIFKKDFSKIIHTRAGEHAMVELHIQNETGEEKYLSVIKEIQHDPVSDLIIHADFEHIQMDKPFLFRLPIEFVGTPVGVTEGGVFAPHLYEIDVICAPKDVPDIVEVDVSEIALGDSIHIKDISIPNGEIKNDPEETIATVVKPRGIEEVVEEAEEELELVEGEEVAEVEEGEEEKTETEGEETKPEQ
ncbi:50S ribosomal protein L25 [bacterium]|nr:MAG: 50S ribosomal protein L25 [bacterium]